MKALKLVTILLMLASAIWLSAAEVAVEAEGKAPGNVANAREQALTDALREAVRKGAGVDVVSSTSVRDFTLEYDRIFASAFGYVRSYTVADSRLGEDGIYRVKIRATVGAGLPDRKDELVLRQLAQLKGSPRVALEISELIENIPAGSDFAKSWFEAAAGQMKMNLVDVKRVTAQSDLLAARAELFGDRRQAEIRRADLAQKADFIIEAKVRGRHLGTKTINSIPGHEFSLNVDLRALVPETGQIIGSVPMAGQELWMKDQAPETAARNLVHGLLNGIPGQGEYPGAWAIFRKVIVAWMVEVDLGELKRVEFGQVSDLEFERLQKTLGQTEKISAVLNREFDSRGISHLDVETRLDSTGLKSVVQTVLGAAWQYDRGTKSHLLFIRAGASRAGASSGGAGESPTGVPGPGASAGGSSVPPWVWALGGAGVVVVIIGAFLLGKKSKN